MKKGITRRWLINTLGVILAILVTIIVVLSFSIQTFYYNGIQQTISGRSNELVNFFGNYTAADTEQFNTTAREYVENFPDKELMELMVVNSYGKVIITSTGFAPDESQSMPDYEKAKNDPEALAYGLEI